MCYWVQGASTYNQPPSVNCDEEFCTYNRALPCSTRPVTTVPRPAMLNVSSMGIWKGLSNARWGTGMKVSTCTRTHTRG